MTFFDPYLYSLRLVAYSMEEEFPVYLYCRVWLYIDCNMGGCPDVCFSLVLRTVTGS
jgi:hypothetical protein